MIFSTDELFEFYETNFSGEIAKSEFIMLARRAEAYIDRMSFYRLREVAEEYADDVKLAICAVAELLYKEDEAGNVASENTDGYSVTYKDSSSVYLERKIRAICLDYLGFAGIFERSIGVV